MRDGGHAGHGSIFVAEADESDGSFPEISPKSCCYYQCGTDHLDHYGDAQALLMLLLSMRNMLSSMLLLVVMMRGALNVVRSLNDQERKRAIVYTTNPNLSLQYAQVVRIHTDNKSTFDGGQDFSIQWLERYGEEMLHAHIRVPGEHNVRNATAALIAALVAGVQPLDAVRALDDFRGCGSPFRY